jgi:hypothetical protein
VREGLTGLTNRQWQQATLPLFYVSGLGVTTTKGSYRTHRQERRPGRAGAWGTTLRLRSGVSQLTNTSHSYLATARASATSRH